MKDRVVSALGWIALSITIAGPGQPSRSHAAGNQDLVFHVTDFGIEQYWDGSMRVGDGFASGHHRVFPELNGTPGAQLLLPMPSDADLNKLTVNQLANEMAVRLIEQVRSARERGISTYEIQLVENINGSGYLEEGVTGISPAASVAVAVASGGSRQDKVRKFAAAAYLAVGRLVANQAATSKSVSVDMTLGSNGTMAFTESASSWKNFAQHITHVELVNGRASFQPTLETIREIGAMKVTMIVSHGDLAAPRGSIARLSTVQELQARFPSLRVFLLLADKADEVQVLPGLKTTHILPMLNMDAHFVVKQIQGGRRVEWGRYSAREIRDALAVPPGTVGSPVVRGAKEERGWEGTPLPRKALLRDDVYWEEHEGMPPPPPPPPPGSPPGGVHIDQVPIAGKADLHEEKQRVLERRLSEDTLFWDAGMGKR